MRRLGTLAIVALVAALASSTALAESEVEQDLTTYARALEASTPERAIRFRSVERTGDNTVRVSFTTSSPSFMSLPNAKEDKAAFTIRVEGGKTWLTRVNGDGSKGEYELAPAGDTYVKVGDKHRAYYVLTPAALRINDRQGYIRTANSQ